MLANLMFKAAKTVYEQYQHSHNPETPSGIYDFSLKQKHAEFYFMDMRGQHEFDDEIREKRDGPKAPNSPDYIILGKNQHDRIGKWLQNMPDKTKMIYIVSPVPVVHWTGLVVNTADVLSFKDDFRDEWDHKTNQEARDEILTQVFNLSHEKDIPVAFLSGDVHMCAVFKLTNRDYLKAKVFQITCSPITRSTAPGLSYFILSNEGYFKTKGKQNKFKYERLAKFQHRNFCILKSVTSDSGVSLDLDFYGETDEDDEVIRKQIKLL